MIGHGVVAVIAASLVAFTDTEAAAQTVTLVAQPGVWPTAGGLVAIIISLSVSIGVFAIPACRRWVICGELKPSV